MADEQSDESAGPAKQGRCPVCGKPQTPRYRPFCSKRCADVDLGRWLGGVYRIATDEETGEGPGRGPGPESEDDGRR
jgi:endogenous inhibitor of DNA gyrase (YacG/DUF329 family)